MKSGRFSEEQIIGILKEQESGMSTAEVCRRHGISSARVRGHEAHLAVCGLGKWLNWLD